MEETPDGNTSNGSTVLLIGNPNVGKSMLFNRLTGVNAVVSNYPGTTVDFTRGTLIVHKKTYEIIDVPGTYSLEAKDRAEEVAIKMLNEHRDAVVVVVLDATLIERGMYLLFEVIERGFSLVVALNMMDVAHDKQIAVDTRRLQEILGVPVVPMTAISGEGVKDLIDILRKARVTDVRGIKTRLSGDAAETQVTPGCGGCNGCGGC